jgi:type IV secretion system protein VirB10
MNAVRASFSMPSNQSPQRAVPRLRQQPQEQDIIVEEDAPDVGSDPQIDSLLAQVSPLQDTVTSMQQDNANTFAERDRQLAPLQAQLDAARLGGNPDVQTNGVLERRREACSACISIGALCPKT